MRELPEMLHTYFDKIYQCGYMFGGSDRDADPDQEPLRQKFNEEVQKHYDILNAVENLLRVKGRYHTEQAYKQLEEVFKKVS